MEALHVKIERPKELRKSILQIAIDTIELMKKIDEYGELREEKRRKISEFKHLMAEIKKLNMKLNVSQWPQVKIEELKIKKKPEKLIEKKKIEKKTKKALLDEELEMLKKRLERL